MAKQSMKQILQGNSYPGRGIVLGCDETGDVLCAYFIMGRSQNSRNRVFVMTDPDTLETRAYDPSQMKDPSLIIYAPVRRMDGKRWIITNGNQTDTIRDALLLGGTFESALRSRTFEPDAPNWTPRISAMVSELNGSPFFRFSILKSMEGDPSCTQRQFFEYENPRKGEGFFLHTYQGDGNPLPSFAGEPEPVAVHGDLDTWTHDVWESLDQENRISLFTCKIQISSGEWDLRGVNKYQ